MVHSTNKSISNHFVEPVSILAEKDLTYEKALEIAQAVEAAETNSKILKNGSSNSTVQEATNFQDHHSNLLRLWRAAPSTSRKKGHLARVCRSKSDKPTNMFLTTPLLIQVIMFKTTRQSQSNLKLIQLIVYLQYKSGPIVWEVFLNNIPVKMELDTGASLTILSNYYNLIVKPGDKDDLVLTKIGFQLPGFC